MNDQTKATLIELAQKYETTEDTITALPWKSSDMLSRQLQTSVPEPK